MSSIAGSIHRARQESNRLFMAGWAKAGKNISMPIDCFDRVPPGTQAALWSVTPRAHGSPAVHPIATTGLAGFPNNMAMEVNDKGEAVGGAGSNTGMRAVLWRNGRVLDLNTLIPANSGWDLQFASAINDRGQIAGWAMRNGTLHAYRLTPNPDENRPPLRRKPLRGRPSLSLPIHEITIRRAKIFMNF